MSLNPGEVKTEHIAPGAVTSTKIADEAITSAKLREGAVKSGHIASRAVSSSELQDKSVTASKIADGAIVTQKLAGGAVTTAKIGESQITNSRIADRAVTSEKLASNAVTAEKIANASITPAKLSFTPPSVARPITPPIATAEIGDAQVTPAKLSFTPTTRPLTPPIEEAEIGTYAVTYMKIAPNSVNDEKLSAGAVTPVKLDVTTPATDGQLYSFDSATGKFKPVDPTAAGSLITLFPTPAVVYDYPNYNGANFYQTIDISSSVPPTAKAVILRAVTNPHQPLTDKMILWIDSAASGGGFHLLGSYFPPTAYSGADTKEGHGIIKLYTPQTLFMCVIKATADYVDLRIELDGYIE